MYADFHVAPAYAVEPGAHCDMRSLTSNDFRQLLLIRRNQAEWETSNPTELLGVHREHYHLVDAELVNVLSETVAKSGFTKSVLLRLCGIPNAT